MTQVLRIPWAFGSVNRALYTNWRERHRAKKTDEVDLKVVAGAVGFDPGPGPYRLTFLHIRGDKRSDPDNFCAWGQKVVLDAIVGKRKDGMSQILEIRQHWGLDRDNPQTIVAFDPERTFTKEEMETHL